MTTKGRSSAVAAKYQENLRAPKNNLLPELRIWVNKPKNNLLPELRIWETNQKQSVAGVEELEGKKKWRGKLNRLLYNYVGAEVGFYEILSVGGVFAHIKLKQFGNVVVVAKAHFL